MSLLAGELMRQSQAVHRYLETKTGIAILLLDSAFVILDCNEGFTALLGLAEKPVGHPAADFVALEDAKPPLAEELTLSFSRTTGLNGYLHCHLAAAENGWLFFCERLLLTESKVIEEMARLNSELLVMQREMVQKNLLLDRLNRELNESRDLLQAQNEELQRTFHILEQETAGRVHAVEALREGEQLLNQQFRTAATSEVLNNLAHQWRQPLNVLALKIQEIGLSYRFGALNPELLQANVEWSMKILNQLSQSIEALRDLFKSENQKRFFRVDQAAERGVAVIRDNLQAQGIALEMEILSAATVKGYPNEFVQVLLTIIMNAKDALQERKIAKPRIEIRCWTQEGKSVVTVTDNAGGIADAIMPKIFDAYFTTKAQGKGTGISLFLAKTIIEKRMGGSLTARNTETGAQFRIEVGLDGVADG